MVGDDGGDGGFVVVVVVLDFFKASRLRGLEMW